MPNEESVISDCEDLVLRIRRLRSLVCKKLRGGSMAMTIGRNTILDALENSIVEIEKGCGLILMSMREKKTIDIDDEEKPFVNVRLQEGVQEAQ